MNDSHVKIGGLLLCLALLGCDDRSRHAGPATLPAAAAVSHPGAVSGRIRFAGTPPAFPNLAVSGDASCCQSRPDGVPDESLVIGPGGGVANAVVYLVGAPRSNGLGRPAALLDQVKCQYAPHVLAVQVNQPIRVKNSDPSMHNVHVMGSINTALNFAEVGPGEQTISFQFPETMRVRCDVHPWMKAIIAVFDHPFFTVAGADGSFQLTGIPPGQYTLTAWHERLGDVSHPVTVSADGAIQMDLTYSP